MTTLRQLERLWCARQYDRMLRLFMEMRPEASVRLITQLGRSTPTAAMAVIRLDELNQAHTPFCARTLRAVLAAQEPDGGWGDPLMTGICVRALLCGHGDGTAVDRGIQYLVNLQKPEGLWPREPLRRLPADPFTSAFILFQLVDDERFQRSVRVRQAVRWFQRHAGELDAETARLWKSVVIRTSAARAWHDAQVWS